MAPRYGFWLASVFLLVACAVERNTDGADAGVGLSAGSDAGLDPWAPGDVGPGEAGDARSGEFVPFSVAPPAPPAPPRLEDGTPFEDWEPRDDCPPGQMPEFGRDGCIWVGDPCPEGDWPVDLPEEGVVYVTPGGTGDGSSPAQAMGQIQAAIAASRDGRTVALSKGRFLTEMVVISRRISVVGACARDTVIEASSPSAEEPTVLGMGSGAHLENVTVTGQRYGVAIAQTRGPSSLRGVIVDGAQAIGVVASWVELDTLVVRGTTTRSDGTQGGGVLITGGTRSTIRRAQITNNRMKGLSVLDEGTELTAEELVVADTSERSNNQTEGTGIFVGTGGRAVLVRALVDNNRAVGVFVGDAGSAMTAEDLIVRNTREQLSDGRFGEGVTVQRGADLSLTRVLLENNRTAGLALGGEGVEATAEDLVVRDTRPQLIDGNYGMGIGVQEGADLTLIRARLVNNRLRGLHALGDGVTVSVEDLVVQGTRAAREDSGLGRNAGIGSHDGASLSLSRVLIEENQGTGLNISGSEATVEDLIVRRTEPLGTGRAGIGIVHTSTHLSSGDLRLTRVRLENNRHIGLWILGNEDGGGVEAKDLVVANTQISACAEPGTPYPPCDLPYGDGVLCLGDGSLSMENFQLLDNARVGVQVVDPTGTMLETVLRGSPIVYAVHGEVMGNAIGINIQTDTVALSDFQRVICKDNPDAEDGCFAEKNLPLPDAAAILEAETIELGLH